MITAAIMLTTYKTSAAMLSAKRPQSMHRIPDATHIFPLNLCVALQFSSSCNVHTTLIPIVFVLFYLWQIISYNHEH